MILQSLVGWGEPTYVQEQLSHATIELTVSTYGRRLKKNAPGVLDQLDAVVRDRVTRSSRLGTR